MTKLPGVVALVAILQVGCSVVGVRTAEELKYTVVEAEESFEVRSYAPYIAAEASTTDSDNVNSSLFRILAGYIFGKNTTEESIPMTAPVVMEAENDTSEKIAMTAPVIMEEGSGGSWTMAFSMPAEYNMNTLPKPLDDRITLVEVPARTLAVIRYSGSFSNRDKREKMKEALLRWVDTHPSYIAKGEAFYAGYDPPFTMPFLRRNEVLLEVSPAPSP